jgi:hypothetical protein
MIHINVELTLAQIAAALVAVIAALIGGVAPLISYAVYRGQTRQLRLTVNERLMGMVIHMDKAVIDHPELGHLIHKEFSPPPKGDEHAEARLIAFMYMHLNMFDVAYNYYCRTLGMNWIHRRFP